MSVTNDLNSDQRVQRTIGVLLELGFEPVFIGRELKDSKPCNFEFESKRFKLPFNRGFLFYTVYNLRLFLFLLFNSFDFYLSNDLDTLLPNYLISKLKRKPLVYDTHEYFLGVPEIQNRPLVKKVWSIIESGIFPKLNNVITVNKSIAKLYKSDYNKELWVVRNIGDSRLPKRPKNRSELGIDSDTCILINQGAGINIDRGMEELVEALDLLGPKYYLLLVGKGDVLESLKVKVKSLNLERQVSFVAPLPYLEMLEYTACADIGLSLDKDTNLNYKYSLPNKLFDYIKLEIPVVVSDLVEPASIVRTYSIGSVCNSNSPEDIAKAIKEVSELKKTYYAENLKRANLENNWDEEKKVLESLFSSVM